MLCSTRPRPAAIRGVQSGSAALAPPGRGRRSPIPRLAGEPAALRWFLFVSFLLNFGQGVYPPLLPEVVGALGLSLAAAGLLGTAFSLPRSLLALPAGMLVERIGPTAMMHAGMATRPGGNAGRRHGVLPGHDGARARARRARLRLDGPGRHRLPHAGGASDPADAAGQHVRGRPHQRQRRQRLPRRHGLGPCRLALGIRGGGRRRRPPAGWPRPGGSSRPSGPCSRCRPRPSRPRSRRPGRASRRVPLSLFAIYLVAFGLAFGWAGAIVTLAPLYGSQTLGLDAAAIGRALAIGYVVEAILLIPVGWAADTFGRLRVLLPGLAVLVAGVILLPLSGGSRGLHPRLHPRHRGHDRVDDPRLAPGRAPARALREPRRGRLPLHHGSRHGRGAGHRGLADRVARVRRREPPPSRWSSSAAAPWSASCWGPQRRRPVRRAH